jgi:hypothetical protein
MVILEAMKAKLLSHLALSLLLLAQSAVAFVTPAEVAMQASAAVDAGAAMTDCHDAPPETPALAGAGSGSGSGEGCCDSMEQACCQFGCASPSQAVPVADTGDWSPPRSSFSIVNGAVYAPASTSDLFRPPRTN